MFESLNQWIIESLNLVRVLESDVYILIAIYATLALGVYLETKPMTKEEAEESEGWFAFLLFIIHLSTNITYSFFLVPDHYIWLTRIFIFILPYILLFFFFYYKRKFGNK